MTMSALIAIRFMEGVVGLTAGERFQAVKQVDRSNPMLSRWFTIAMVVVLVGSIAALVIVSLCKKIKQRQAAKKTSLDNAARKSPKALEPGIPGARPANGMVAKSAFIAMFPTVKKAGLANVGALSPPGTAAELSRLLPEFLPATVTGLFGRVVFLETMLKAGVGDRVLVVLSPGGNGAQELVEDMGLVQQSSQPAESIKSEDSRRLAIALVGISEQQSAQLAGTMGIAKATQTAAAEQPVGAKGESK